MIISASRRTDIPACYSDWFMNRLRAGEVLVPNPYSRKKINRITLSPDTVDCIAFWTKNPRPMLPYLKEIDTLGYKYYFQMSITGYGTSMEMNIPSIEDSIATFMLLSERLGKKRVDWRYDPIIIDSTFTLSYHKERFEMMCQWLHKYTTRCIISFVDSYKDCNILESEQEEMEVAAKELAEIARKYNLALYTCSEKISLKQYGISQGACINKQKIEDIIGYRIETKKDVGQRKDCNCIQSIDIGMYDTCVNGCKYCYATGMKETVNKKFAIHNPFSPLLIGDLQGDEIIVTKNMASNRDYQLSLFDYI